MRSVRSTSMPWYHCQPQQERVWTCGLCGRTHLPQGHILRTNSESSACVPNFGAEADLNTGVLFVNYNYVRDRAAAAFLPGRCQSPHPSSICEQHVDTL